VQGRLKDTIQQLEHSLLALQSDLDQLALRNKEAGNRVASLTALLARKTEEADRHAAALSAAIVDNAQIR
jgi:chromosome segregation ATPase